MTSSDVSVSFRIKNKYKSKRQPDDGDGNQDCDGILECVLPPRRWRDGDGTRWTRRASDRSAARADVDALTATFETSLLRCRARAAGVCPTRRAIYSRCFDETLRQVRVDAHDKRQTGGGHNNVVVRLYITTLRVPTVGRDHRTDPYDVLYRTRWKDLFFFCF